MGVDDLVTLSICRWNYSAKFLYITTIILRLICIVCWLWFCLIVAYKHLCVQGTWQSSFWELINLSPTLRIPRSLVFNVYSAGVMMFWPNCCWKLIWVYAMRFQQIDWGTSTLSLSRFLKHYYVDVSFPYIGWSIRTIDYENNSRVIADLHEKTMNDKLELPA